MTCKYKTAAERGGCRAQPIDQQIGLAKRMRYYLDWIVSGESLPTPAEIQADEYDGSVPFSEWLARGSRT